MITQLGDWWPTVRRHLTEATESASTPAICWLASQQQAGQPRAQEGQPGAHLERGAISARPRDGHEAETNPPASAADRSSSASCNITMRIVPRQREKTSASKAKPHDAIHLLFSHQVSSEDNQALSFDNADALRKTQCMLYILESLCNSAGIIISVNEQALA